MNELINNTIFPTCCTTHLDREFYIKDNRNSTCEISGPNDYHIKIKNNKPENINFLKIDHCVYGDGDPLKCDCAFSNNENLYFVEIKELENAQTLDDKTDHNKRKAKRKEARGQLANTINEFRINKGLTNLKNTFAVITLIPKLDNQFLKIISAKEQSVIDEFFENCGCPNLYEGNLIEF